MNILFLSYWAANDGLSTATVIPHLQILTAVTPVKKIVYCSIERNKNSSISVSVGERVTHLALYSGTSYFHKIFDFLTLPKKLGHLIKQYEIDMLICRGAPAGSLGYLVNRDLGTPYVVESFEPHASYMVESGVWTAWGLKYRSQSRWERKQLKSADWIITVSANYKRDLVTAGADEKRLAVASCAVDADKFALNETARARVRARLGFNDSSVAGIYVGKFGGMYYNDEAFGIFAHASKSIANFKLVILTPDNPKIVEDKLRRAGLLSAHFYVCEASHNEVPDFLSAADFAFALYKPSASKRFLSPIKIGEYWASGLPVLLTKGVGDDSDIIDLEGGGFTFCLEEKGSLLKAIRAVSELIMETNRQKLAQKISKLARKYRSFDQVRTVYEKILSGR